jgi:hypothetical protein
MRALAIGLTLVTSLLAGSAGAQPNDDRSHFTFQTPVEIPGRILPPGEYEFRIADPDDTRNVVQILNAEGTHVIATVLTVDEERVNASAKPIITFERRGQGEPEAIRAWFPTGDSEGKELVYPKTRATAIAKASGHRVKATSDEMIAHMTADESQAQAAAIKALQQAPVDVVQPSGAIEPVAAH